MKRYKSPLVIILLIISLLSFSAILLPTQNRASEQASQAAMIDLTPAGGDFVYAEFISGGRILSHSNTNSTGSNRVYIYENNSLRELTLGGTNNDAFEENGQIIGTASLPNGASRAFIYTGGAIRDLGTLPGKTDSLAYSVNSLGQVVGSAYNQDAPSNHRAFLHNGTTMIDLGVLPGRTTSVAYAVDNSQRVLGASYNLDANNNPVNQHAFLYNGSLIDLTPVSGNVGAGAYASFLPDGRILSSASTFNSQSGVTTEHSYIYENGALHQLTLGGASCFADYDENSGQIIGSAQNASGQFRAFIYTGGMMRDLGTLAGRSHSAALGANSNGQVVGVAYNLTGTPPTQTQTDMRAFLYNGSSMVDLGVLPGTTLSEAYEIDNTGRVIGNSYNPGGSPGGNSNLHSFLYNGRGQLIDLTPAGGNFNCFANFISGGRILSNVTTTSPGSTVYHSYIYEAGTLKELTLGGASNNAYTDEESGQIIGQGQLPNGNYHAFIYTNGTVRDLGTLPGRTHSDASSANASGQTVGWTYNNGNPVDNDRAFFHDGTSMIDLGVLPGTNASYASQIDNAGNILGNSYNRDSATGGITNQHAFLVKSSMLNRKTAFDFDGDSKTDISIFRPSNGQWWYQQSSDNVVKAYTFGNSTDKLAPADYDGDNKTDIAFFRPSTGEWYVVRSSNGTFYAAPFGLSTDTPTPGDFDADSKADVAVYRASQGVWYILKSSDNQVLSVPFGNSQDIPVVADYDGDNKSDVAIYRPNGSGGNGEWWVLKSTGGVFATPFGSSTDKPVQGDYTGDGKADCAYWKPSTGEWFVLRSENLTYYAAPFGAAGDIPVAGDYDGDGKFDLGVFRPSSATWFVNKSNGGNLIQGFGATDDKPLPATFVP